MEQRGEGEEALGHAFLDCHLMGRDMEVGDIVALNDGSMHRCEASGWTDVGRLWTATIQQGQQRRR
jgi:hypothetical protein